MILATISDEELRKAAEEGTWNFIEAVNGALLKAIGGELTAENMSGLNADQITLIGYAALHEEVMDGGFVELIHNGWGSFIFLNPFAKAIRLWGVDELATMLNKGHRLYCKYHVEIERDCTDEEFMALFEKYPEFDSLDDTFVENEESFTDTVARYVDDHLSNFVNIV